MERSEITSLVLSGRAFSEAEVEQIQETVRVFSKLGRLQALCEHLDWVGAQGVGKVDSCLKALRSLEALELIQRPAQRR